MRRVIGFCRRWAAMAVLAPILAACAVTPLAPTIAYHPSGGARTIALLTPYVPPHERLTSLGPVTLIGYTGLLGVIYDQSVQKDHEIAFDALLARQGFRPRAVLARDVTQRLEGEGYRVVPLAAARPGPHFLAALPPAPPGVTLELDVVAVHIGYLRLGRSYRPDVELKYRLVRTGTGQVLGEGAADYSALGGGTPPDPAYSYAGYGRFAADPSRAAKALSELLDRAAARIAAGLH
ncbi:hypothetical protein AiwAL_04815 [Acidiphilium sp. AL]|uniref:Lipoprotein n=1 Tax=Acidiphilium iwatense TaxID=768198 RepID=A0ABS9DRJ9_9PROT|nr:MULTISPECIES: hypothetical protein [Acidiphilium]MCF3945279.1 hypothetical protein [Acidiphilium iwatense]MCU4159426.1 hypothetical protein [Acidiphilium sp. AL]